MRSSILMASALALFACSAPSVDSPDYELSGGHGGAVDPGADPSGGGDHPGSLTKADAGAADAHAADAHPNADAAGDAPPDAPPAACPVLTFPSGIKLKTFKDSAMSATYKNHLGPGDKAPECFIDTDNLVDPDTGSTYDLTVNVATHFELTELVGTEVSGSYGHLVLVSPDAVAALEKLRDALGGPLVIVDGFRSPKHQEEVCNTMCGNPLGCTGTCGNNSRHIFGDGFDLPLALHDTTDEQRVCSAGFKSMSVEDSARLHVDQNPATSSCVPQ
jgi:hypothetical protein